MTDSELNKIPIKEKVFDLLKLRNDSEKDFSRGSTLTKPAWKKVLIRLEQLKGEGKLDDLKYDS
jgi:hypothetical protein